MQITIIFSNFIPPASWEFASFKNPEDRADITAVNKVMAGDKEAFEQIVDRYRNGFVQRAAKSVHNFDEAEDIASDMMTRVYEKIMAGRYKPTYTFNAWINCMFANYMKDYYRKDYCGNKKLTVSMDNIISDSEGSEATFSETMDDRMNYLQ